VEVVEVACMVEVVDLLTMCLIPFILLEELVVVESVEAAERRGLLHLRFQLRPEEEVLAQEATAVPVAMVMVQMEIPGVDLEPQAAAVLTLMMTLAFQEEAMQEEEDLAQIAMKDQEEEESMEKTPPIINMGTLEDMAVAAVVRAVAQTAIGEELVGLVEAGEDPESMEAAWIQTMSLLE
jgi:hypothetical protein